jgi:sugar/nucleoside kinase (ribokinase family)
LVVEWHLSVGNVNVDLSLVLDGYPVAGVNAVARDLWFGVGGAAVNYASCIVRLVLHDCVNCDLSDLS